MIPVIVILIFVFLIQRTIKSTKVKDDNNENINTTKYCLLRIGALIVAIPLIILICYLRDGYQGFLGAFYLSYIFAGIWLLYLLIEAACLYIGKQNKLAKTSLLIFFISICIIGLGTFSYFDNLN